MQGASLTPAALFPLATARDLRRRMPSTPGEQAKGRQTLSLNKAVLPSLAWPPIPGLGRLVFARGPREIPSCLAENPSYLTGPRDQPRHALAAIRPTFALRNDKSCFCKQS
jgi:hypothetical protein